MSNDRVVWLTTPAPTGYEGKTCPKCGSAWFDGAMCLDSKGRVVGTAHLRCRGCATPFSRLEVTQ